MRIILLLSLLLPGLASAERFDVLGRVELFVTHNAAVFGNDGDYITLADVTSVGTCLATISPRGQTRVIFRVPDSMDRAFEIALKAQFESADVKVSVDDTIVDASGACILRWITTDRRRRAEKADDADELATRSNAAASH